MPREEHITRQIEWQKALAQYGNVHLEASLKINDAPIIADVYAEIGDKHYIIEIGDIEDKRKEALLELLANQNSKVIFAHEHYGENKMPQVLETVQAYLDSEDYKAYRQSIEKRFLINQNRKSGYKFGWVVWLASLIIIFCFGMSFENSVSSPKYSVILFLSDIFLGWILFPFLFEELFARQKVNGAIADSVNAVSKSKPKPQITRPLDLEKWVCSYCDSINTSLTCQHCGAPKKPKRCD